jgi:hypothetical protein
MSARVPLETLFLYRIRPIKKNQGFKAKVRVVRAKADNSPEIIMETKLRHASFGWVNRRFAVVLFSSKIAAQKYFASQVQRLTAFRSGT